VSIVVPVHNEAPNLPILWDELVGVLDANGWAAEVIFVDDGSTDGSLAIIRGLAARDRRVRLVRLAAHAGLSAAFDAGLRRARGSVVVTMDGDLQSDPHDIPTLLARLDGCDVATGWRQRRQDAWPKRVSSRLANLIRNAVTRERIRDSACTLRAMRRQCVVDLPPYRGLHRFVPTLLRMAGHRVVEVPVNHRPRRFGVSHYGIRNRAWAAFQDLLVVRWMQRRRLRYEVLE
jgi:glycosyltransferase involved in cell wall biosynthesis